MSNPACQRTKRQANQPNQPNRQNRPSPSEILDYLSELNPDAALLDGYEHALIGVSTRFGQDPIAIYDKEVILQTLERDMTREEAIEYFEFNIIGAYVENCPSFLEVPEYFRQKTVVRKPRKKQVSKITENDLTNNPIDPIMDLEL